MRKRQQPVEELGKEKQQKNHVCPNCKKNVPVTQIKHCILCFHDFDKKPTTNPRYMIR